MELLRPLLNHIYATNVVSCNVPQVLDSLDITVSSVPSINLYLFELIQNALDARADSIDIELTPGPVHHGDYTASLHDTAHHKLVFQHNGPGGLGSTDQHVRGMSNVFQSTKSIGSVGFMGFGFKTLYKRFAKVVVSDTNGWKFHFLVSEKEVKLSPSVGEHDTTSSKLVGNDEAIHLKTRGWLGAVCPVWDSDATVPSGDFTTRFEMSSVVSSTTSTPLYNDISEALFSGGMNSLAVLATQGLKSLKITDHTNPDRTRLFRLEFDPRDPIGLIRVTQIVPTEETYSYYCLASTFEPSISGTQALAQARLKNILQHHQHLDRVIKDIRKPYRVLGIIPLDSNLVPIATKGQLYATLPIRSFVPFGMSIQADWLLDLSRKGLRDVETSPWQQSIVRQTAKLLALFLQSIRERAGGSLELISSFFAVFGCDSETHGHAFSLKSLGEWIREELNDAAVFPIIGTNNRGDKSAKGLEWAPASQVVVLPSTSYRPKSVSKLIGFSVVDEALMGTKVCQFLVNIGLLKYLDISDIVAKFSGDEGVGAWFRGLESSMHARRESLIELWAFLAEFAPSSSVNSLKCIPIVKVGAQSGGNADGDWQWTSPVNLYVFELNSQYCELPDDELSRLFLLPSVPQDALVLPPGFLAFLLTKSGDWNGPGRVAYEWVSRYWNKKPLKQIAKRSFMNCTINASELESAPSILDRFSSTPSTHQPPHTSPTPTAANLESNSLDKERLGPLLSFTRWAITHNFLDLVSHVITHRTSLEPSEKMKLVEISLSVLGSPYVDSQLALIHERLFSDWPRIHPVYSNLSLPPSVQHTWASAFTALGAKGPVVLEEYVAKELGVYPSYTESRKLVADILEISHDSVLDFQTTSRKGWKVVDTRIKDVNLISKSEMWPYLAHWFESNVNAFERGDAMLVGQGEVWRIYVANGRIGTATWCKQMNQVAWVPQLGQTELVRPFEAQRERVSLSPQLIRMLEKKGVYFGRTGAQKMLLDQVATFDASALSVETLPSAMTDLAHTLSTLAFVDSAQRSLVSRALDTSVLPLSHSSGDIKTVPFGRLVRVDGLDELSALTLNGFLTPLRDVDSILKAHIEKLDDLAVITLPRWPTAQQATLYWRIISDDSHASIRSVCTLSSMFDCLTADQASFRRLIRQHSTELKLPTPGKLENSTEWTSLSHLNLESLDASLLGTSRRVQSLVRSELHSLPNGGN